MTVIIAAVCNNETPSSSSRVSNKKSETETDEHSDRAITVGVVSPACRNWVRLLHVGGILMCLWAGTKKFLWTDTASSPKNCNNLMLWSNLLGQVMALVMQWQCINIGGGCLYPVFHSFGCWCDGGSHSGLLQRVHDWSTKRDIIDSNFSMSWVFC